MGVQKARLGAPAAVQRLDVVSLSAYRHSILTARGGEQVLVSQNVTGLPAATRWWDNVEVQAGATGGTNGSLSPSGTGSIAGPVRLNLLVAGTYAWAITVAIPAWGTGRPATILCAVGAVFALFGGVLGSRRWPRVGRAVTMAGFLGLSCVTWLLMGTALNAASLEPVRSALGALGWMVFALGWGTVRQPGAVPEDNPHVIREAEPLSPRRAMPWPTLAVFGLTIVSALAPWLAAWTVERQEHALLAHASGLGIAMWMLVGGSQIAVSIGAERAWAPPRVRLASALPAMAWSLALAAVGGLYWVLGGES